MTTVAILSVTLGGLLLRTSQPGRAETAAIQLDSVVSVAGEPVKIEGVGFAPGELVTLTVTHANGTAEPGAGHEEWFVDADDAGQFNVSWSIQPDDVEVESFVVSAKGQTSGSVASAGFRRIAVVLTDKYDYSPGEEALIRGAGFRPFEAVTVHVEHSNGMNDGAGHFPFDVFADFSGRIDATWLVDPDDSEGAIFRLTAVGNESGLKATATFTDILITVVDDAGADDEPGQKDLNYLQIDYSPDIPDIAVVWGWDDIKWSGNNTGDACTLFDTDGDGFANYSLCITVDQAGQYLATRLYSCDQDSKSDRCAGPTEDVTFSSTGSASVQTVDPFGTVGRANNDCSDGGAEGCLIKDTVANLTVKLADFPGAQAARLINVCSYPSQEPNSDPSDCIFTPNSGFLNIVKIADPDEDTPFTFNASEPSNICEKVNNVEVCQSLWTINGSDSMLLISYDATTTLDLNEVVPDGWQLDSASCEIKSATPTPTGTPTATGVDDLEIKAGLETTCTFEDSKKKAKLTVIKEVINGDGGTATESEFSISVNPSGCAASPSSFDGVGSPGQLVEISVGMTECSYNVTEDMGVWTGKYAQTTSGDCSGTIAPGEEKTCTITNDDIAPTVTLTKEVVNDFGGTATAGQWVLSCTGTGGFFGNGTGTDTQATLGPNAVRANEEYTLSESGPDGYAASAWSCLDGETEIPLSGESNDILTLDLAQDVVCTIVNSDQAAHLELVKVVANDYGGTATAADWTLKATGPTTISGAGGVASDVSAGAYSLSEMPIAPFEGYGYTAGDWSCVKNGGDPVSGNSITLANGDSATCTITNSDVQPKLKLVKTMNIQYGGTATAADFQGSVSGTDVDWGVFVGFNAGNYTAAETSLDGYTASAWGGDCAANGSVTLAVGDEKTCTITNSDVQPKLKLVKTVDNTWCAGVACAAAGDFQASVSGTDIAWDVFVGFNAGSYDANETGPTGYTASDWTGDCSATGSVTLEVGDVKTCYITNSAIPAQLKVLKLLVPADDVGTFDLSIDSSVSVSGVGHNGTTGFVPVTTGVVHTIGENAAGGTLGTDYVATIGAPCSSNGTITLGPGESATCTITNTRKGMVTLHKLTNGADSEAMNWNFALTGPEVNESDTSPPTTVDFGGVKLLPGETYTVCETGIPAGWTLEWQVDTNADGIPDTIIPFFAGGNAPPTPWTGYSNVYDPNYVEPPGQYTNDTRCVQFTVEPGQSLAFQINNSFPGGEPRTIGYWKNWNTCTGGRQSVTAADNGGPAAGWYILDDLLNDPGYTIGDLMLDGGDCEDAVNILDKRDTEPPNKKMANDGAYNLAAQLLAAELNLSAGAETCQEVVDAVFASQALLDGINFTGTGSYLRKGSLYAEANSLASILDQYNNGNLCTP